MISKKNDVSFNGKIKKGIETLSTLWGFKTLGLVTFVLHFEL